MKTTSPLPLICVSANAMESAERRRPDACHRRAQRPFAVEDGGLHSRVAAAGGRGGGRRRAGVAHGRFRAARAGGRTSSRITMAGRRFRPMNHRSGPRRTGPAAGARLHRRARAGVRHLPRHSGDQRGAGRLAALPHPSAVRKERPPQAARRGSHAGRGSTG